LIHVLEKQMTATTLTSVPNGTLEIITPAVQSYLDRYHTALRKTAQSVLEVAATVLEAKEQLSQPEFAAFLQQVGFDEKSSTYKKFIAIARKKELLEHYVDTLPTAWTTIYQLAKLDADQFEQVRNSGQLNPLMSANQISAIISGGAPGNNNRAASDVFIATMDLDTAERIALHSELSALCQRYGVTVRFAPALINLVDASNKDAA
jgi:hypothetical protein